MRLKRVLKKAKEVTTNTRVLNHSPIIIIFKIILFTIIFITIITLLAQKP
jgi:hypothetical protein